MWDEPVPDQWKEHIVTATAVHLQMKSHESAVVLLTQDVDNQVGDTVYLKEEPMAPK